MTVAKAREASENSGRNFELSFKVCQQCPFTWKQFVLHSLSFVVH